MTSTSHQAAQAWQLLSFDASTNSTQWTEPTKFRGGNTPLAQILDTANPARCEQNAPLLTHNMFHQITLIPNAGVRCRPQGRQARL